MSNLAIARMRGIALQHGTFDPFELAEAEGVPVRIRLFPDALRNQFGMTYPMFGRPTVYIDEALPKEIQPLILCHELTHALFDSSAMAAYLDQYPDVRYAQRELRAWSAGTWLWAMNRLAKAGLNWQLADQLFSPYPQNYARRQ